MSVRNILYENVVLPVSDLVTGQHVSASLRFLKKSELWTRQQIDDYQNDRLRKLIKHAVTTVPYYRDLFKQLGLTPDDIQTKEDLRKIPIVDKTIMRKEGIERFTAETVSVRKVHLCRSSGSTGEPFSFFVSKDANELNTAAKLRTWYRVGYRLGDKYMKIANGKRAGFWKRIQDIVNNCIFVYYNSIDEVKLQEILRIIENEHPMFIRSYPAPLFLLAQYRKNHNEYLFSPKFIMTTGSTLSKEYRDEIEQAFGCKIIDSYSCEGTPNTFETITHDGYLITDAYGIIEVLDEKGENVLNGIGRVVATDLWNDSYPFIRYDTHDLVEVNNGKIIRIMGRESESYVTVDGIRYTVHNFSRFFLHEITSVEAYQIVKTTDESVCFRLVVSPNYSKDDAKRIIKYWSEKFRKDVKIELVREIPIMNNNKRLAIVNE